MRVSGQETCKARAQASSHLGAARRDADAVTGTARAPKASTVAGGEALGRQDVPPGCPSETGDSPDSKTAAPDCPVAAVLAVLDRPTLIA